MELQKSKRYILFRTNLTVTVSLPHFEEMANQVGFSRKQELQAHVLTFLSQRLKSQTYSQVEGKTKTEFYCCQQSMRCRIKKDKS